MNKKGFTLVELLGVIAIMGIIIVIAVPATGVIKDKTNEYMLDKKIELIEKSAIIYGEDNINDITDSTKKYNGNNCIVIKVKDLVPEYLESETTDSDGYIEDVTSKGNYLDEKNIIIYLLDENVKAKYQTKDDICS